MSLPYNYKIITHWVAVTCTDCDKEARFEFAERMKIEKKVDIPYFEKSKYFEYQSSNNSNGQGFHLAYYFQALQLQHGLPAIDDLPDGYDIHDWTHSEHLYRPFDHNHGTLICINCGLRRKHNLDWPNEAYFQITYRGQTLWAYDRRCASEIMYFIQSKDRKRNHYKFKSFLLKLPTHFLTQKARNDVVKRLKVRLEAKAD